jgi:hypothetical protein
VTLNMHHLIAGASTAEITDHVVSVDTLDYHRSNLRICTNARNQQNTAGRGGKSHFKDMSWNTQ